MVRGWQVDWALDCWKQSPVPSQTSDISAPGTSLDSQLQAVAGFGAELRYQCEWMTLHTGSRKTGPTSATEKSQAPFPLQGLASPSRTYGESSPWQLERSGDEKMVMSHHAGMAPGQQVNERAASLCNGSAHRCIPTLLNPGALRSQ